MPQPAGDRRQHATNVQQAFYPIFSTVQSTGWLGQCMWAEGGANQTQTINNFGGTSTQEYGPPLGFYYQLNGSPHRRALPVRELPEHHRQPLQELERSGTTGSVERSGEGKPSPDQFLTRQANFDAVRPHAMRTEAKFCGRRRTTTRTPVARGARPLDDPARDLRLRVRLAGERDGGVAPRKLQLELVDGRVGRARRTPPSRTRPAPSGWTGTRRRRVAGDRRVWELRAEAGRCEGRPAPAQAQVGRSPGEGSARGDACRAHCRQGGDTTAHAVRVARSWRNGLRFFRLFTKTRRRASARRRGTTSARAGRRTPSRSRAPRPAR